MPHVIRLRGPWTYHLLDSHDESIDVAKKPGRISMPARWLDTVGSNFQGQVRFVRPFGQPTGLEAGDRVFVVVRGAVQPVIISVNGRVIEAIGPNDQEISADITAVLEPRNLLILDVDFRSSAERGMVSSQQQPVDVRLEIHTRVQMRCYG